jgi:hypothetical protein
MSLFDNNPYAAGEEHEYTITKKGVFDGFHVGIVSTNKKHHRKSDKLRALLAYISRHVQVLSCSFYLTIRLQHFVLLFYCANLLCQCAWIHTVFNGNFSSDLSDAVVYLCRFLMSFVLRLFFESVFQWRLFGCAQGEWRTGESYCCSSGTL